ncbi:MAG: N-acetylmuramoyl-L-alanine amidase [Anaerolineae bacterium]|nr:N-acetylmuramoyl-L-alanine amidase [Anaerolineae bacterium]
MSGDFDDFELHTYDTAQFGDEFDAETDSPVGESDDTGNGDAADPAASDLVPLDYADDPPAENGFAAYTFGGTTNAVGDTTADNLTGSMIDELPTIPEPAIPLRQSTSYRRERTRRRQQRQQRSTAPVWLHTTRTLVIVGLAAVLVSTIFSLWTRPNFFSEEFRAGLNRVQATQRLINIQPSPLPTDIRTVKIGIIAGHSGPPQDTNFSSDPGAVCDDGLTELSINDAVARQAVALLQSDKYTVDLLEEFDSRLRGYQADALISVHTNDCGDYGAAGTGFNAVSASGRQTTRGADERLLACLIDQYGAITGLPRHFGVTFDMTEYHTFGEIAVDTPIVIIELGFMRNDRLILTQQQDLLAQGIANAVRCFLNPLEQGG